MRGKLLQMEWASQLGLVMMVVLNVHSDNVSIPYCVCNDDCLPHGCCLASFVNDEKSTCQSLGEVGQICDNTLSVSVPGQKGEEVAAKNKYLGHCPCAEHLVCTKEQNVSRCAP